MSRIRVLIVINGLGAGGAERSTAESILPLRERGIDVEVAVLQQRGEGVEQHVAEWTTVHRVAGSNALARARSVRRIVRATKPDLVHSMLFEADLVARLATVGTDVPLMSSQVNTSYDPARRGDKNVTQWKLTLTRWIDAWTARLRNVHHHAISNVVAGATIESLRVRPEQITVVPRGRDRIRLGSATPDRRRTARETFAVPDNAPLVVNVGRQEYQKGQVHLIRAIAHARATMPDIVAIIAGRSGNASPELTTEITRLGLRDAVHIVGHIDNIGDLLAAGDVFAFPSLYEGLGGALLEAMAMGVPAVVSDIPVLAEVGQDTLVRVPPGEPVALGDAVVELLQDPARRDELAASASDRFRANYELQLVTDGMAALYRDLVQQQRT